MATESSIAFSVVIPSFNRAKLLPATLASIQEQRLPPVEIILIDDGSTDDTCGLIRDRYASVRYHRIANSGPGVARWTGMTLARAEWIAFCDSDDLWTPDHLGSLARAIERFPGVDFVFSNFCNFREDAAELYYDHFAAAPPGWWERQTLEQDGDLRRLKGRTISDFLLFNPAWWPSCGALHRSLLQKVGKTSSAVSRLPSEDGDLTRRLALCADIACSFGKTALVRKHDSNFSANEVDNILGRAHTLLFGLRDHRDIFRNVEREVLEEARTDVLRAFQQALWHRHWAEMGHLYDLVRKVNSPAPPLKHRLLGRAFSLANPLTRPWLRPKFRFLLDVAQQNLGLWRTADGLSGS